MLAVSLFGHRLAFKFYTVKFITYSAKLKKCLNIAILGDKIKTKFIPKSQQIEHYLYNFVMWEYNI